MPQELVDRPSDETGSIKRQPRMDRVVPVNGSRQLAHNTPHDERKGLIDFILPDVEPLVIDSKHIATGKEAFLIRSTKREARKSIQEELRDYESTPNNPRRKRLLEQRGAIDSVIEKATKFLNQWQGLDNDNYLQHLIDTEDELSDRARQLLHLRTGNPGVTYSDQQKMQMRVISEDLRDRLLARVRLKQQGK